MRTTIKSRVDNWRIVPTQYGKRLVLNTTILENNQQAAVWSKDLNCQSIKSKHKGTIVELEIDERNNYSLVDRLTSSTSTQVLEQQTNLLSSEQDRDLYLPDLYSDDRISEIVVFAGNRAKILVGCISAVRAELEAQGEEINDHAIRSLGISLFIQISRNLE